MFEVGQKIKHRKYGKVGTFLGTDDKNQFTVILDNQELALDPMPIEYIDDWVCINKE